MSNLNSRLLTQLQAKAAVYTQNYNIPVRLEGSQPYTTGTMICLPFFDPITEELQKDLNAYLEHEIAHCLYTQFEEMGKAKNNLHKFFLNMVEDIRIEKAMMDMYPNTRYNLKSLRSRLDNEYKACWSKQPWAIRMLIICQWAMNDVDYPIEADTKDYLKDIAAEMDELKTSKDTRELRLVTEKILTKLKDRFEKEMKDPATKDQFEKMQKDQDMKEGKKGEKGKQDKSQKGQKGEQKGQGQQAPASFDPNDPFKEEEKKKKKGKGKKSEEKDEDPSDEKSDEEESEESDSSESSDQSSNSQSSKSSSSSNDNFSDEGLSPERKKELDKELEQQMQELHKQFGSMEEVNRQILKGNEEVLDKVAKDIHSDMASKMTDAVKATEKQEQVTSSKDGRKYTFKVKKCIPLTTRFDTVTDYTAKGNPNAYNRMKQEMSGVINPLKIKMERIFKVRENAHWKVDQTRGSINVRTMAQAGCDPNFTKAFKELKKAETNNVAVEILNDCSGSMSGSPMELCKKAMIAMGESLKALNIPFEITGFTGESSYEMSSLARSTENVERFSRVSEALKLFVFKDFNSSNMSGITEMAGIGSTPEGDSVMWAARRLAERTEKRKILLVFADGQPAQQDERHDVLHADLRAKIMYIKKYSGIEVVGVGIQTDCVKHFYDDYLVVNEIQDLPRKSVDKLRDLLLKGNK